jgi:hypothetical protein
MANNPNSVALAEGKCSSSFNIEQVAYQVIAACGGDARAAVIELVAIVRHLADDNNVLASQSSCGLV